MVLKGFGWPLTAGDIDTPELIYDEDVIAASLRNILMTGRGERVMRPGFGAGAVDAVFENMNDVLATLVKRNTIDAIRANEPRITLTGIRTSIEDSTVTTYIEYEWNNKRNSMTVTSTNSQQGP